MKRICSMILVLALFWQLLPVQALAEAGLELPGASELAAARALTGIAEDAPGYHAGMSVSSAMNAMQLSGWLDELLGNEMVSLQSAYQNIQTALERMKVEDPGYYGIMTDTPNNIQYPPRIEKLHHQSEELREELAFYSHRLVEQSTVIDSMMERLSSDEYSDTEKARAARKLESAAEIIRDIRDTVVQRAAGWETKIDTWMSVLRGDYIGQDQETFVESSWVYLVMEWKPVIAQAQVSTVSLYPKGETLLERLSPVRSALAETKQDVTLSVVSQKNFVISVKDGDTPIEEATVIAQQGKSKRDGTVFGKGRYSFNVSDFTMNKDGDLELSLRIAAPGYRTIQLRQACVKKGQIVTFPLKKDDGTPYVVEAVLDDNDIYYNQCGIYYSTFNDWERSISVTVSGVTGTAYCALEYTDASSGERVHTEAQRIEKSGQTVTFSGKWNQLLKPGEELVILLGTSQEEVKNGIASRFPSTLTVQRGPVEKPFYDTTGAFTNAFNPLGSGLLSFTLPGGSNMPKFISGSMLTLDLPFSKHVPRLVINMDGSFSFSLGYQTASLNPNDTVDANGQKVERWKTQDQRDLEKSQKDAVEKGGKSEYLAKAGAMWDGCKSTQVRFLGKASASVSVFFYLYGRYQHDEQGYGSIKAKGGIGVSFTFGAEFMQTFGPIFANVGLTASLAVTFQVGMLLDTYWPEGGSLTLGRFKTVDGMTGFTILLRLQVDISVGVGIKGLLSVSVHGYGYISILLELMGDGTFVTVSGRLGFYVLVQVFWLKWKVTLYDLGETVLYTNRKKTAGSSMLRILEPFLPSAVAEGSGDAQEGTSLTPLNYPKLEISNAQAVLSNISLADDDVQILTLNGETYAFYLEKMDDGTHVKWMNLNDPAKTGDFTHILIHHGIRGLIDYDFTVGKVAYQEIQPIVAPPNEMGVLCVLATPSMKCVYTELENGEKLEMQEPSRTVVYYIGFTGQTGGSKYMKEEFFGCDDISRWNVTYVEPTITLSSCMDERSSHYDRTAYYYVDISALPMEQESSGRQAINCLHIQSKQKVNYRFGSTSTREYKEEHERCLYTAPEGKKCYQVQRGSPELFGRETNRFGVINELATRFDSVYALVCENESPLVGETQLIHRANGTTFGPYVLDKGQIRYFKALIGEVQEKKQTDVLFYLAEEEAQGKTKCRLKGIRVEHKLSGVLGKQEKMSLDSTALTDYDVIVPASSFDVATVDGTTYLYWMEAIEPENAADTRRYRICGVIYDPIGDRMTDDFVLAEFVPEHSEDEPQKIMLTATGKGYYIVNRGEGDSAVATLYSFPFRYVPSLDLKQIALSDTLVSAGSYNDLVFTITNDGNTAISSFELQLQLLENGVSTTVQTIHADIISPNQSYSQTQMGTVRGEQSIYRMEDAAESLVQSKWHIQRKHRQYDQIFDKYIETEDAQSAENGQLLPGMTAAFKTALWIPASWAGEKQVRLQLSRWSADAGWTDGVWAAANGMEEEIVYELRSDGTMVRVQEETNALMRAQPESSLYVSAQAADESVPLNAAIHDIELDYRLYRDAEDVQWISLVITDEAATAEPIRLYALVYPDDGEESISVALPYFDRSVSIGGTHCIDLPVSALLGGQSCHKARVAVYGIGVEERDDADNEILLVLNENIPQLSFALQPQDRIALEGETITLSVEPAGGVKPYTYQWQVSERDGKWTDIEGETTDTLSVGPVTMELQGWRYRCQVTDHYLTRACSDEAKLTVTEAVPTGDESRMELVLAVAVCALLALLLLRRKTRRPE